MIPFLLRRILLGITVLWVIVTIIFIMFYVAPTDVAALPIAGRPATPETVRRVRTASSPRPADPDAYVDYLWNLLHADLRLLVYNRRRSRR